MEINPLLGFRGHNTNFATDAAALARAAGLYEKGALYEDCCESEVLMIVNGFTNGSSGSPRVKPVDYWLESHKILSEMGRSN